MNLLLWNPVVNKTCTTSPNSSLSCVNAGFDVTGFETKSGNFYFYFSLYRLIVFFTLSPGVETEIAACLYFSC